jgi:hypothetical protein
MRMRMRMRRDMVRNIVIRTKKAADFTTAESRLECTLLSETMAF